MCHSCVVSPPILYTMWRLSVLALIAAAAAQIPSLGWCPANHPVMNFEMERFLGTWYEAERYFTIREIVSRCVTTKYESTPEGRILVSNEITNSLTGLKRVVEGYLNMAGRDGEGRFIVKYSVLPIPYDTEYSILDTDYDNWAVMWSCSGIGPVHTQNAWVLTRERLAPSATMQAAYGVLDRHQISRTFFVKTPQEDCNVLPVPATPGSENAVNEEVEEVEEPEEVEEEQKSAGVVPVVDKVVKKPVAKIVDTKVKPETPEERSVVPETSNPIEAPELIKSGTIEIKKNTMDMAEKDMPMNMDMPAKVIMPKTEMPEKKEKGCIEMNKP